MFSVDKYNSIVRQISTVWLSDIDATEKRSISDELFSKIKYSPYFILYSRKPTHFELVSRNTDKSASFIIPSFLLHWRSKEGMIWLKDIKFPIPDVLLGNFLSKNNLSKEDVEFLRWLINDLKMVSLLTNLTETFSLISKRARYYENENFYDAVRVLVGNNNITKPYIDEFYFTNRMYYECLL